MKIAEILLVELERRSGSLARVLQVIGDVGLIVDSADAVERDQERTVWEITLSYDERHDHDPVDRINALANASVIGRSDRVFSRHEGGKIATIARHPVDSLQTLRDICTPGVARVCLAIPDEPSLARRYTYLGSSGAVNTNGTVSRGMSVD